jgi:hypothetical protein
MKVSFKVSVAEAQAVLVELQSKTDLSSDQTNFVKDDNEFYYPNPADKLANSNQSVRVTVFDNCGIITYVGHRSCLLGGLTHWAFKSAGFDFTDLEVCKSMFVKNYETTDTRLEWYQTIVDIMPTMSDDELKEFSCRFNNSYYEAQAELRKRFLTPCMKDLLGGMSDSKLSSSYEADELNTARAHVQLFENEKEYSSFFK